MTYPDLRAQIVEAIMGLVRKPPERRKATIEELERILSGENQPAIQLEPDGTCLFTSQTSTTVGDVADAVLDILSRANSSDVSVPREPTDDEVIKAAQAACNKAVELNLRVKNCSIASLITIKEWMQIAKAALSASPQAKGETVTK